MKKPIIKNLFLLGIPTIISAIGVLISIDAFSSLKSLMYFITAGLLIAYVVIVIYYGKSEKSDKEYCQKLERENENLKATISSIRNLLNTNSSIVTSFVSVIEPWTTSINKIANDIKLYGKASEKDWDYEKICTDVCVSCKNAIKQFTCIENDTDLSVGLIKYYCENGKEYVKMLAHSSPQTAKPDIFDVQEVLSDCNYQYAKLIKDKTRSIYVLENKEKIKQCFHKRHASTDLSKYEQYIAIPILCSKNKILGVLQITTKYGYKIMETEIDLKKFGETYITPFVELLILVEKVQKGLFMTPNRNDN